MARLKSGALPTSHNDRLVIYRNDLVARGGTRVTVDLEPDAHEALRAIMGRAEPPLSRKAAISDALVAYARAAPKKHK